MMNLVQGISTLEIFGFLSVIFVIGGAVWAWYKYKSSKLNDGWLDDVDPTDDEK
jgi:hypothetical protein